MNLKYIVNQLNKQEKKLFFNKTVLLDTANIILKYGIEGYQSLIKQITEHQPKEIIGKMDASARYKVEKWFGKKAFNELNRLINNGDIECAPSRSECDVYLIQANIRESDSIILTNDAFLDFNPFWVSVLRLVKFLRVGSQFYFNLDLKGTVEDLKETGVEQLWNSPESIGEIDIYPEEGVN